MTSTERFQSLSAQAAPARYVLRLYVTGMSPRSTAAVSALKSVCEQHLAGRYDLEVVDLYRSPDRAQSEQIVAAPTLVKEQPLPERRLIGNLTDLPRLLRGLSLAPA